MPSAIELLWLVCIAHVWSRGTIFKWIRTHGPKPWIALADCPLCAGWWIGMIGHVAFLLAPTLILWLGTASLVATASMVVYCAIRRL